ncbi:MAG: hypothetical protein ACJ8CR_25270 [Roseiflexaceae bacterium]
MPDNALTKKMKLKPGQHAAIVQAPAGYVDTLRPLPENVDIADQLEGTFDWVQLFVKNQAELERLLPQAVAALKLESMLWISFPKGTSKIQTDLTRDRGWDAVQQADLKWLSLVSVNETWSAFALRPYKPGEQRQSFR